MIKKFLKKYNYIRLIDVLVIGYYIILSLLLLVFHKGLDYWLLYIIGHLIIIYIIFVFLKVSVNTQNKFLIFLKNFYPIILYTVMYEEVNLFVHVIFSDWIDAYIYNLEYMLFGFHPTVLMQKIVNPFVTEFFKFTYFSYYFIVFVPAFIFVF